MAFINEVLTPEQREEFRSWNLKRPIFDFGCIIKEVAMDAPFQWTVDKERNMYLLGTSFDRNYLDENVFLFIWNHKNYLVQFTLSYDDDNTSVWNIPKNYMIDNVFPYCTEDHFLDDLRDALLVHGKMRSARSNREIHIRCNF